MLEKFVAAYKSHAWELENSRRVAYGRMERRRDHVPDDARKAEGAHEMAERALESARRHFASLIARAEQSPETAVALLESLVAGLCLVPRQLMADETLDAKTLVLVAERLDTLVQEFHAEQDRAHAPAAILPSSDPFIPTVEVKP